MIDFHKLIEAGVHFGHQTARRNPRMIGYIWGARSGVHLIDVSKTAQCLERAAQFLESVAAKDQTILWVGTKKQAQDAIRECADALECPRVTHRWVGGTLTNYSQVKKSVTKLLHFEDVVDRSDRHSYTKKELMTFKKTLDRLSSSVGGIRTLTWPVGAVFVVDIRKEATAIKEARAAGIPVVALVDTNCDPSLVDYVIPANDDSPKSIHLIVEYVAQAARRGYEKIEQEKRESRARKTVSGTIEDTRADEIAIAIGRAQMEDEDVSVSINRPGILQQGAVKKSEPVAAPKPATIKHEDVLEVPVGAHPAKKTVASIIKHPENKSATHKTASKPVAEPAPVRKAVSKTAAAGARRPAARTSAAPKKRVEKK